MKTLVVGPIALPYEEIEFAGTKVYRVFLETEVGCPNQKKTIGSSQIILDSLEKVEHLGRRLVAIDSFAAQSLREAFLAPVYFHFQATGGFESLDLEDTEDAAELVEECLVRKFAFHLLSEITTDKIDSALESIDSEELRYEVELLIYIFLDCARDSFRLSKCVFSEIDKRFEP